MRAENVTAAYIAMSELTELESVREKIAAGTGLDVVLCAVYQDKHMMDAARPGIIAELDIRLAAVKNLLRGLGVQI